MTLNANFAGATLLVAKRKLQGTERGLDALVGLVILVSQILIGFLAVSTLFVAGTAAVAANASSSDATEAGFAIALFGSVIVVGITMLVFLVRVASGRRSWRGTLLGAFLMTAVLFVGYVIMASGS